MFPSSSRALVPVGGNLPQQEAHDDDRGGSRDELVFGTTNHPSSNNNNTETNDNNYNETSDTPLGLTAKELEALQPYIRNTVTHLVQMDRGITRNEAFVSQLQENILYDRVKAQLRTEEDLHRVEHDIGDAVNKGLRTRQTLDSLESHVLKLRKLLRTTDTDVNAPPFQPGTATNNSSANTLLTPPPPTFDVSRVKSAADSIADELANNLESEDTEPCPKCGKRYLAGFLRRHLEECDGVNRDEEDDDDDRTISGEESSDDDDASDNDSLLDDPTKKKKKKKKKGVKTLEELKNELAMKRTGMTSCPVCLRSYPKSRIVKHADACQKKQILLANKANRDNAAISTAQATPPNAPIRPKALAPTCNAVPLIWDPPIFDGGAPIFDYHIQYFRRMDIRVSRRETRQEENEQPMISTSRWLFAAPIAHRGFVMQNLVADAEYVRIRIRAVNEKGPGPWSEPIASIHTLAAVPPSPPLQLILAEPPKSTSITLKWQEPLNLGGGILAQYEIRYSQNVADFAASVKLGVRDGKKIVPRVVRFSAPASQYTITSLLGNCTYTDFVIIAISADGLLSVPSAPIKEIRTPSMTREEEIMYELHDKRNRSELEVEVFYNRSHQIMNREAYIALIEKELKEIQANKGSGNTNTTNTNGTGTDGSNNTSSSNGNGGSNTDTTTTTNNNNEGPKDARAEEMETRRVQFQYRINIIQGNIDRCSEELWRLLERRAQLKHVLVTADRRWRILNAEYDHLKDFPGKQVDSAVMHGRNQRFRVEYLRQLIREELDEIEDTLAAGKAEMVKTIESSEALKKEREKWEDNMKERRSALLAFEKEEQRRKRALTLAARIGKGTMVRCFQAWKYSVVLRKQANLRLHAAILHWSNIGLSRAFRKWLKYVEAERLAERIKALEEKDASLAGLGSAMLASAWKQRNVAIDDATSLLGWLRGIEEELDAGDAELAYRRGLRTVDTLVISSSKGAMQSKQAITDESKSSSSDSSRSTPLGPAFPGTLPLSQTTVSKKAPLLQLVDGAIAAYDPGMKDMTNAIMKSNISEEGILADYRLESMVRNTLSTKGAAAINTPGIAEQVDSYIHALLARAEAYMKAGKYDQSLLAAKQVEMVYGYRKDPKGLLAVYRILSMLLEKVGRFDIAILHWSRAEELAREPGVNDPMAIAEALEGRGRSLHARSVFADALLAFERAEDIYEERNDAPSLARVYLEEAATLHMMQFHDKAERLEKKAQEINNRRSTLVFQGLERLRELETELVGMGVGDSRTLHLQVCGPAVPLVRQQLRFLSIELFKLQAVLKTTKQIVDREQRRLDVLQSELKRAEISAERTMETNILSGGAHVYEIGELRVALRAECIKVSKLLNDAIKEHKNLLTRITNMEDEIQGLQQYLGAETRDLAKVAYAKRPLRAIALNVSNWRTNHVLGVATGGTPKLAAALDTQVYVYSTLDGELLNSFVGDTNANPMGRPVGHTKHITCIAYYGGRVYTGSTDCTVRGWDAEQERGWGKHTPVEAVMEAEEKAHLAKQMEEMEENKNEENGAAITIRPLPRDPEVVRQRKAGEICVMRGHEGTVVCLAVNHRIVVSGGADKVVMVWHPLDGRLLRRLRGHELSVTSIAIDDNMFASGSADREIRVWEITQFSRKNPAKMIEQVHKYKGHNASVTALSIQGREVVSGAANGEVIVWDFRSGNKLRMHQVHAIGRTIFALQFDSVKIVSAGADNKIIFTDLLSGEPLQTILRPHGDSHVLGLGFDSERLLTVAADRSMRHWAMKGSDPVPVVKLHIIRPGEKLSLIARKYDVKIKDLMRWNGLEDARKFYEGMRILVAPPPGTEAYEQARKEEDKKLRQAEEKAALALKTTVGGEGMDSKALLLQASVIEATRVISQEQENLLTWDDKESKPETGSSNVTVPLTNAATLLTTGNSSNTNNSNSAKPTVPFNATASRFFAAPGDDKQANTPYGFIPLPHHRKSLTSDELLQRLQASSMPQESTTVASVTRLPVVNAGAALNKFTKQASQTSITTLNGAKVSKMNYSTANTGNDTSSVAGGSVLSSTTTTVRSIQKQRDLREMAMVAQGIKHSEIVSADSLLSTHVSQLGDNVLSDLK